MEFRKYLKLVNKGYKQAAKELSVHPIYLNKVLNGAKPGPKLAIAIEQWSERAVTRQDLRPDLWPS